MKTDEDIVCSAWKHAAGLVPSKKVTLLTEHKGYTVPTDHGALEEVRGGNAFKHWAHLRLLFRRGPKSTDWPDEIPFIGVDGVKRKIRPGWGGRIKLDKTRLNTNEGQEVLLTFMHGKGFDSKQATLNAAFGLNVFRRGGSYYYHDIFPEGKIHTKEAVIKYFSDNEEAFSKLMEAVNEAALNQYVIEESITSTEENIEEITNDNL